MTALRFMLLFVACGSAVFAKDELSFEKKAAEVKVAPEQDLITVVFPFKNTSDKVVKLGKIESTCDCTNAVYRGSRKSLAPGERGEVEAVMKTGTFSGVVEKGLIVNAEGSRYNLTIKADIPEVVKIQPRKLQWKKGQPGGAKEIVIKLDPKAGIRLTDVSLEGDDFDYEPVTVKASSEYKVVVTPKSTEKTGSSPLWILTDSRIPRYSRFLVFLTITSK